MGFQKCLNQRFYISSSSANVVRQPWKDFNVLSYDVDKKCAIAAKRASQEKINNLLIAAAAVASLALAIIFMPQTLGAFLCVAALSLPIAYYVDKKLISKMQGPAHREINSYAERFKICKTIIKLFPENALEKVKGENAFNQVKVIRKKLKEIENVLQMYIEENYHKVFALTLAKDFAPCFLLSRGWKKEEDLAVFKPLLFNALNCMQENLLIDAFGLSQRIERVLNLTTW